MVLRSQLRQAMAISEGQTYLLVSSEYHPGQGKMGGVTHARFLFAGVRLAVEFHDGLPVNVVFRERARMERDRYRAAHAPAGGQQFQDRKTGTHRSVGAAVCQDGRRYPAPRRDVEVHAQADAGAGTK